MTDLKLLTVRSLILVKILIFTAINTAIAVPGFYPPEDDRFPEKIQQASRSVFRLVNLGQKILPLNTKKWATDYKAGERVLENNLKKGNFNKWDQSVLQAQLNICEESGRIISECNLMFGFEYSTAFITGDGSELWTTFHSLRHYLHLVLKENLDDFSPQNPIKDSQLKEAMRVLKSHPIPIILSDREGEVSFESAAGDKAYLDLISEKAIHFIWSYDWQSAYSLSNEDTRTIDFVRLKLSRSIGKGLKIELNPPPAGEGLYISGFPKATANRRLADAPDSDGNSQYTTHGRRLNLEQLRSRLKDSGYNWARGLNEVQAFSKNGSMIAADADGTGQMSGSPLLTTHGTVIGVYQGSTDDDIRSVTTFSASLSKIVSSD